MTALLLAAGLAALILGAEILVKGASRLARGLGLSPLVIGLTVVAFGTSMPEMAVSVRAGLAGQPGICLGNVVGSNIFNILFILGLSALVAPLAVSERLVRLDVPVMVGVSALAFLMGVDGRVSRGDGAILVAGILIYTALQVRGQGKPSAASSTPRTGSRRWAGNTALVLAGLVLLVLGSRWFVAGAASLARALGMGEFVIGLTIVAAGTSLPEAATSIVASARGERDIAVGNVVGSNVFNILAVLGAAALVAPDGIPVPRPALRLDLPVMVGTAAVCLPVFLTGRTISRWEGAALFAGYVTYTAFLVLGGARP